jgi:hypothetical protein
MSELRIAHTFELDAATLAAARALLAGVDLSPADRTPRDRLTSTANWISPPRPR